MDPGRVGIGAGAGVGGPGCAVPAGAVHIGVGPELAGGGAAPARGGTRGGPAGLRRAGSIEPGSGAGTAMRPAAAAAAMAGSLMSGPWPLVFPAGGSGRTPGIIGGVARSCVTLEDDWNGDWNADDAGRAATAVVVAIIRMRS